MNSTGTTDPDGIRLYSWNWDDGTPDTSGTNSSSRNPTHTFATAGTYTITLTVTDNWGRSTTETREVTVQ
jgi:PKD repeat protein